MSASQHDPAQTDPFSAAASLEGVPSAFAGTRDGLDAVLRDRGLRRSTPEDTAQSLLLGARATSTLEGSEVTVDELAYFPEVSAMCCFYTPAQSAAPC